MIEINNFEGPLDLLLHLIKQSEMDIFDINIETITKQYLEYIEKMEELNLNIASEYLVMAAELIEIKSYTLLPKHKAETDDEYEEDPREQLISRLLEYEKYKNVTSAFKECELERMKIYSSEPVNLSSLIEKDNIDEEFKVDDLINALNKMFERKVLSIFVKLCYNDSSRVDTDIRKKGSPCPTSEGFIWRVSGFAVRC